MMKLAMMDRGFSYKEYAVRRLKRFLTESIKKMLEEPILTFVQYGKKAASQIAARVLCYLVGLNYPKT